MGYAVATGHALTTRTAADVLDAGGTAVDACVAAAAVAFVAEPVLAQPLGGGAMMLAPAHGKPRLLDAFVDTPRSAVPEGELDLATVTVDFGTATQDFHIGAGTIAVPCLMQGLLDAQENYGRIPLKELLGPAQILAREGVDITAFQAHVSALVAPILTDRADVAALHAPDGKAPKRGQSYSNHDLADVLEVLAVEGPRFFTHGEVAQALATLPGSHLTLSEISAATPRWRKPLEVTRAGTTVSLNPPPSLGGVQIALLLSTLPHRPAPATIAAGLQQVAEVRKRLKLDVDPLDAATLALDAELVESLRRTLANHRPATRGTTHISVTDRDGNGAALTLTNGESCGRLLPGTGILPNNMLGEEDLVPDGPTSWTAGQRLATMMCPTALREASGRLTMLGSGGSNRIRSALSTTLLGMLDEGHPVDVAVAAPRMHVEGDRLSFEDTGTEAFRAVLLADWPEATVWAAPNMYFGGVHIARCNRDGSGPEAAGDARRYGAAEVD